MDGSTPAKLFQDTTSVKLIKPELQIYVSIGGWTFSNNHTKTQAVFGDISADPKKRQTFADNAIKFMKQYGFNGIDLDWEYPGAPDRGGKARDKENYVELLKTLRRTFDASGANYGLTFTVPSSYWYLRWFDLEKMVQYADWVNLMSYDLHGAWDADNPIGSIVQAHTNLTEIKQAVELFWRVNVPPAKVVMGFGFYGRSFTLSDPSCNKPGCPFKGAASPGPCSNTGGILAYYEIMSALNGASTSSKRSTISPTHDKEHAVNYFTFDEDQKIKTNRDLQAIDKALSNPVAVVQDLAGSNGQKCFVHKGDCVHLNDNGAMSKACGKGYTPVGWDDAGCGTSSCHCGKPVCCPTASAPKNCIWRGDDNGGGAGSDCSAQCRPGEINIKGIRSSWGGGFLNDGGTDKCGRGYKAFCCPDPNFSSVTSHCSYAACGKDCPTGKKSVFTKYDKCWTGGQKYCCRTPIELKDCNWVGGSGGDGDCANANCNATEVEIDRATYGDHSTACDWGRKKAMCCTIKKQPPPPAMCTTNLCKELPGSCPDHDDDESANGWTRRDLSTFVDSNEAYSPSLEKRSTSEYKTRLTWRIGQVIHTAEILVQSISYPTNMANLINSRTGRKFPPGQLDSSFFTNLHLQVEHIIDRQIIAPFLESATGGYLPSDPENTYDDLAPVDGLFISNHFETSFPALGARSAIGGPDGPRPDTLIGRLMHTFGSSDYRYPFLPTEDSVNGAKGRIMGGNAPTALTEITKLAKLAVSADTNQAADKLISAIRVGFAVFDYLQQPDASLRWNKVIEQFRLQAGFIETDLNLPGLVAWWDVWFPDFLNVRLRAATVWADQAIIHAVQPFQDAAQNNNQLAIWPMVNAVLTGLQQDIGGMAFPAFTQMHTPAGGPPV
ncbi:hypothetical protein N7517_011059 [Penicillium concentricum]|uniref:chitinase n=1 Tax=Penicillium concentricum TaxID=293559 RepID=A0A9W9RA26_9EURO|nr:uncharacterized protein N7517_011059 [Penicillium concentricum]KAJ5356450.1 hypothetical protein N7517_011059 [Penicillium concentricum]